MDSNTNKSEIRPLGERTRNQILINDNQSQSPNKNGVSNPIKQGAKHILNFSTHIGTPLLAINQALDSK